MKTILVLGAGKSAGALIDYLGNYVDSQGFKLIVADPNIEIASQKIASFTNAQALPFDVKDKDALHSLVNQADVVVSMLPAFLHPLVLEACIFLGKDMLTASYATAEIKKYESQVIEKGITVLMECGLDPGIDHFSALEIIERIKNKGGIITSFKSFCGGLVAPENDTNPWHYKFSWNPRNVILAGQGTAQYLDAGNIKYIPYQQLFNSAQQFDLGEMGVFEGYANRDSLSYLPIYDLPQIETFVRGTLRGEGYCKAWHLLVKLGLTDDSFIIPSSIKTWKKLISAFTPTKSNDLQQDVADYLNISLNNEAFQKLVWLGIFNDETLTLSNVSPATHLQALLEQKWKLEIGDKDRIIMIHEFEYLLNNQNQTLRASLDVIGEDENLTAMAKTVGLPLAKATELVLTKQWNKPGIHLPLDKKLYEPITQFIESKGIKFVES